MECNYFNKLNLPAKFFNSHQNAIISAMQKKIKPEATATLGFIGISLLIPNLVIFSPFSFPYLGLAISFLLIAGIAYTFKQNKSNTILAYFLISLILCVFLIVRANPFLTFLNIIAIVYAISLMVNDKELTGPRLLYLPFTILANVLKTKNIYTLEVLFKQNKFQIKPIEHLMGIIITLLILMIILPALSYSNVYFDRFIKNIINNIAIDLYWDITPKLLIGLICWYTLPKLASYVGIIAKSSEQMPIKANVIYLIPKIVLCITLFIFFATQIQLYFPDLFQIFYQIADKGNSSLTREVFAQLTIVACIIFTILYLDNNRSKKYNYITYLLIAQTIFLTLIGFKSVYDYSSNWGFTVYRLWGFTGVIWLLLAFTILIFYFAKNLTKDWLVRSLTFLSFLTLIGINLFNFEGLILKHLPKTHEGIDYMYIADLSPDVGDLGEILAKMTKEYQAIDDIYEKRLNKIEYAKDVMVYNTTGHSDERINKNTDIRAFNLSVYMYHRQEIKAKREDLSKLIIQRGDNMGKIAEQKKTDVNNETKKQVNVLIVITNLPDNMYDAGFFIYEKDGSVNQGYYMNNNTYVHTKGAGKFKAYLYLQGKIPKSKDFYYEVKESDLVAGKKIFINPPL